MMQVTAKINRLLWLLSGRSSGFTNVALNTGVAYSNAPADKDVVAARELLCLTDTRSDFYALGAMASLYLSFASLRDIGDESSVVFGELLQLQEPLITGASLLPSSAKSWPSVRNVAAGRMAPMTFVLSYQNGATKVTPDFGASELMEHQFGQGRLAVPGLARLGIEADFLVDSGTWGEGDTITLTVPLSRYPFKALADMISQRGDMISFMGTEGMIDAFASASTPAQKVGALAVAIVRRIAKTTPALVFEVEPTGPYSPENPVIPANALLFNGMPLLFNGEPLIFSPLP